MLETVYGKIIEIKEDGGILIGASLPSLEKALIRKYNTVEILLHDGRRISPEQRRKIYALMREISEYVGDDTEAIKKQMKLEFMLNRLQGMQRKMFSLADVDMNTASEFISYLIEFILANDIPCNESKLSDLCEDIGKYVYACLMTKHCAVCGSYADLHHVDKIGMGNDRDDVHHLGRKCLPLCRVHHTEIHEKGLSEFLEKYHLQTVEIDENICKKYKLRK